MIRISREAGLNRRWAEQGEKRAGKDHPTDVLSFPLNGLPVLGDW